MRTFPLAAAAPAPATDGDDDDSASDEPDAPLSCIRSRVASTVATITAARSAGKDGCPEGNGEKREATAESEVTEGEGAAAADSWRCSCCRAVISSLSAIRQASCELHSRACDFCNACSSSSAREAETEVAIEAVPEADMAWCSLGGQRSNKLV